MKKTWLMILALCTALLWCLCAGAEEPELAMVPRWMHTCTSCGEQFNLDEIPYSHDEKQHWKACPACQTVVETDSSPASHAVQCQTPTTCDVCGAEGIVPGENSALRHPIPPFGYAFDQIYHWEHCPACGWVLETKEIHCADCLNPTTCMFCGAEDIIALSLEHGRYTFAYDQERCWQVCLDCGNEGEKSNHYDTCTAPGECAACGQADVKFSYRSHFWGEFEYDQDKHWMDCPACGERFIEDEHGRFCHDAPDTCSDCLATGVNVEKVWHDYSGTMKYDQEHHWWLCIRCEAEGLKFFHSRFCDQIGCSACGQTDVTINIHFHEEWYKYDANSHWVTCPKCGEIPPAPHWIQNGVCLICSYEPPAVLPGDVSGDGEADIFDALAILQYAVGWEGEIDPVAGDVNDDGECDIFDALLILQYAVGWDVQLK